MWFSKRERERNLNLTQLLHVLPFFTMTKKGGGCGGGGGEGWRATKQSLIQGGSSLRYNPLSVILLPLRPASLMQEQSPKIHNNSWNASHRMQRTINRFEYFLGRISCSTDFCGCFLKMHIHFYIQSFLWFKYILGLQPCDKVAILGVNTIEFFLEEFT